MNESVKLSPRLHRRSSERGDTFLFWCPACQCCHPFDCWSGAGRPGGEGWRFDGNVEAPTFSPSLRVYSEHPDTKKIVYQCHLVLERGVIRYCDDCTHDMRGQSSPMQDIPPWYGT